MTKGKVSENRMTLEKMNPTKLNVDKKTDGKNDL